jgi:predicted ATPase
MGRGHPIMRIEHLRIEGFKSWRSVDFRLAPITGLFGANSSGKSSLIQFILMLKQTKEATDRSLALNFGGQNSYTDLGSFRDIVSGKKEDGRVEWSICWDLTDPLEIIDPRTSPPGILFSGNQLSLSSAVELRHGQPITSFLSYEFSGNTFSLQRKDPQSRKYQLQPSGKNKSFHFIRNQGRAWDLPGPIKSYAFPDQAKTYFQNADFLSDFELSFESLMDSIFYLGPLREYPRREYIWGGASPTDVGRRGERTVDAILAAEARREVRSLGWKKRRRSFQEILALWLYELGLIAEFRVEEIARGSNLYRVRVKQERRGIEVLLTDVGFGVSQFLPILVLLYYVPENSIVVLEQPEIHLHPHVQSGLGDVLINVVKSRKLQVIVESHSEHLLRRVQRRIAEGEVSPAETALYFCDVTNGQSRLTPLEVDLYGSIRNWPRDFFGDEFGEIAAIQEAGLQRRLSAAE